jgi:hypothetical protein
MPAAPNLPTSTPASSPKLQWAQVGLLLIFLFAAIAGMAIMQRATRQGIGIFTDSTVYLNVARNLLQGRGFVQSSGIPLTQYPPLYPAVLALSGLLGGDLMSGAKWLQILLYVANVLLVGLLVYRGTNGSLLAAAGGLLFALTSQSFLYCHALVLSEALFLFFTLAGLLLVNEYLRKHSLFTLIAANIILVLACLTRYIGCTLIIFFILSILFLDRLPWRNRLINIIIICTVYCLPCIIWLLRNKILTSNIVNRNITFHIISIEQIKRFIKTIWLEFLLPLDLPIIIVLLLLLAIGLVAIIILLKSIRLFGIYTDKNRVPLVCICFLFVYTSGLVLSVLFVEAYLPFNSRILLPFHAVLGISLISLCANAFHLSPRWKWFVGVVAVLGVILIAAHGQWNIQFAKTLSKDSMGYNSNIWRSSRMVEFIKALPDDAFIYSNGPDAIDYLTGKLATMIPSKHSPVGDITAMMQSLKGKKGFLVYFNHITWRGYLHSAEELKHYAELHAVYEGRDGTIHQVVALTK